MQDPMEAGAGPQVPPSENGALEVSRIATFLRLRPVERPSGRIEANAQDGWVEFNVPRDASAGCGGDGCLRACRTLPAAPPAQLIKHPPHHLSTTG